MARAEGSFQDVLMVPSAVLADPPVFYVPLSR